MPELNNMTRHRVSAVSVFPTSRIIKVLALSLHLRSYYEAKHPLLSKINKNNKVSAEVKAVCTFWAQVTTVLPVSLAIDCLLAEQDK